MNENRKRRARLLAAVPLAALLPGCVNVTPPDKPIEINLNVKIEQEVLVRLQRDVEQIIRQNPQDFPDTRPQSPRGQ